MLEIAALVLSVLLLAAAAGVLMELAMGLLILVMIGMAVPSS